MILVSVGTQLPFDRLVSAMDAWAAQHPDQQVFAQIGESAQTPNHLAFTKSLSPVDFDEKLQASDVVVAHAGMGTIIGALELARPIIVMPRRADLGEHRNDHQLATAEKLGDAGLVRVVTDDAQLHEALDQMLRADPTTCDSDAPGLADTASAELIAAVSGFIHTGRLEP